MTDESALLIRVRELRDANGWGRRTIGKELGISPDQAHRLLQKIAFEDARRSGNAPAIVEIEPRTASEFAERIASCWRQSVEAIFRVGDLLTRAKATLPHGEFESMVTAALPFGASTARRLMLIAQDEKLSNRAHVHVLPASWGTLYEMTKLDTETFEAKIADGTIRPDTERATISQLAKMARMAPQRAAHAARRAEGCRVADLHELAARGARFGGIMADPGWKFATRSEKGEGRSAGQHYTTTKFEEIKAQPLAQLAADDCVLFLWIVDWFPPRDVMDLIDAWGFEHKTTAFTWAKTNPNGEGWHMGQGYWTRANPETCLLCTRGNPTRLAADVRQLIVAPVMEHSAKPDEARDSIERLVAGPYLELNARKLRPGWTVWGDEIPRDEFLPPHDPETGEVIEGAEATE